ncbi:hypothetical protein H6Y62_04740 [Staphylococcus lugdunensis]|uniref:Uncharacterized protein n=4 Tax=Staphylococcus TaxID=1279 RepID=A0A292DH12_STALU|nr:MULTISPECIES: hypothetical protein [Staphylococcus]MDU3081679.1 hypothetical protein [Staphylococcus epidermidis]AMG61585.1 hypothetical protein AL499_06445 [Staphylococcus lugdunensis]AMG62554.1 hypothetical protein AL499_11535 [Staphylococcus lugdunensis]AST60463.1 hypothetical protein BFP67_06610 [Staphylococcus lugdunensis]AST61431.1 hypothetical protein BFP67_11715 [Staphylococcus lugdunensis]
MKTLDQIEKYKTNIEDYRKEIKNLDAEVKNDGKQLDDINQEYQDLVINGEVEKADKLYTKIEKLESDYRAKSKRLMVMKQSFKKVVIKNCENMQDVADELSDEYNETYQDDLKRYETLNQQLKDAKDKLLGYNDEYSAKQRTLTQYIDRLKRENNIQPVEFIGNVNIIQPFNI